ncbi:MAG TPA: PaaI family thioesterase [Pyrinomonadaceae bacterium]|jgi:acyl-CoA thioesterase
MSKEIREIDEAQKQRAAEALRAAPFPRLVGLELVDLKYGEAIIKLEMRDELRQPYGLLHGGATATLIDTTTAFAVITCQQAGEKSTTVDLTIHYLRPHTEGEIVCTARVVRAGRRITTVSAEVFNADGKQIATALTTYMKV